MVRSLRPHSLVIASALAALSIAGFVVTLERSPVAWPDSIIYASIARALQLDQTGVPTVLRDSPAAADHLPFYGPVFFQIVAWLFALFGLSERVIRSVSLSGALVIAAGGAGLAGAMGGSRERQAWVGALLLLSPEIGRGATDGRMDTLAVGLEVLALATFVRGFQRRTHPWLRGAATGALISAAALTTPRTYPFVVAFFAGSAALVGIARDWRGAALRQIAACWVTVLIVAGAWTVTAHGSPGRWFDYMSFIGTHENIDVALLAASRDWSFTPWATITPLAIVAALILAASKRHAGGPDGARQMEVFGWLVAGLNLALGLMLFNFTFFFAIYIFMPMLALVLASVPSTKTAGTLLALLVAADVAVRTGRYVRLAAVWPATDPEQIGRFVKDHVPPGSDVLGEESFYYFAVERAGSHYLFVSPGSTAEWARWAAVFDPPAVDASPHGASPHAARFLLWPADEARHPVPAHLACARREAVAVFDPLPLRRQRIGLIPIDPRTPVAYPKTALYRLQPNRPDTMTRCPASN